MGLEKRIIFQLRQYVRRGAIATRPAGFIPTSSTRNIFWSDDSNRGNGLEWTTGLIVQIIAGLAGAHFAATALHEHRFGPTGHRLVGPIAGALSGTLLQTIGLTGPRRILPCSRQRWLARLA